jgi:hypothetical protein
MTKIGPRAKQSDRDVWRVGVLFSRSGLMAVSESEHFFGTALAIEEINNAGAILGREIEVVAYAGRPFEIWLCRCGPRTASLGEFGGFCFARMGA